MGQNFNGGKKKKKNQINKKKKKQYKLTFRFLYSHTF